MKTKRIRMLTSIAGTHFSYGFNQVVDHDADEAGRLVASSQAEFAEDAPLTFPPATEQKPAKASTENASADAEAKLAAEKKAVEQADADAKKAAKAEADAKKAADKAAKEAAKAEADAKKAAEKAAKEAAKKASASEKK